MSELARVVEVLQEVALIASNDKGLTRENVAFLPQPYLDALHPVERSERVSQFP